MLLINYLVSENILIGYFFDYSHSITMEKYTCMSSQHVLPSKQTLSNITKNRNICCHQCHLKYVKKFWANGKSKLPANFTCKHKVTSIGLKYDDRHAEIPKYRVTYWPKNQRNFLRISALSCKKRSDQKNKGTLYH